MALVLALAVAPLLLGTLFAIGLGAVAMWHTMGWWTIPILPSAFLVSAGWLRAMMRE